MTERAVVMKELLEALDAGRILEVFGAGTACVVCPVGSLLYKGEVQPHLQCFSQRFPVDGKLLQVAD